MVGICCTTYGFDYDNSLQLDCGITVRIDWVFCCNTYDKTAVKWYVCHHILSEPTQLCFMDLENYCYITSTWMTTE